MRKAYKCKELDNVMSFRENTLEQLILVIFDEREKSYKPLNIGFCNEKLQNKIINKLIKMKYKENKNLLI